MIIQENDAGVITSSLVNASNSFILIHSQCQVDVHINENAGINFIEVKGGLTTGVLANTTTIQKDADKQVHHEAMLNHDLLF